MAPRVASLALVFLLSIASCGGGPAPANRAPPPPSAQAIAPTAPGLSTAPTASSSPAPPADVDFLTRIPAVDHWNVIRARPGSQHLANTEVVKVVLDRSDGQIYFMHTGRFPFHYDFARRFLHTQQTPVPSQAVFNFREYHAPDRRFILGTLARYVDAGVWAFELQPSDELDLSATARAFDSIRKLVFFGNELRYRPAPAAHERDIARARSLMPVVTSDEIYGKIRYQPLELGESYGYLRVLPRASASALAALTPRDIVVLGDLPEEVPVVAGVISAELQAPLGHINVLCHNRKTPNMALRGALSDVRVIGFKDKLVRLAVDGQSFRIEPASSADAERSWEASRPKEIFTPKRDDRDVGMPLLSEPRALEVSLTGAKAAGLARAAQALPRDVVPKAFALPFHGYARFLKQNGFDKRIDAMLAAPELDADPERRQKELAALRAAMEAGTVPADLLRAVTARIKQVLPRGPLRFRSSTNAEDLPGFNGAGLYRSARVADPSNEAEVASAMKKVWSSVWLSGAFEERRYYKIDHRSIGMAILIQTSVDDVIATGVAITANPFNQAQPAFFINAQAPGGSVTGARGEEVPEQILYYTFEGGQGVERLSRSSRSKDRDLLSPAQVDELSKYLSILQYNVITSEVTLSGRAVDVEFLVTAAGRVVIVQARPYTMVWTGDRRWRMTLE